MGEERRGREEEKCMVVPVGEEEEEEEEEALGCVLEVEDATGSFLSSALVTASASRCLMPIIRL